MMRSKGKQNWNKTPQFLTAELLREYTLDLEAANKSPKTISEEADIAFEEL